MIRRGRPGGLPLPALLALLFLAMFWHASQQLSAASGPVDSQDADGAPQEPVPPSDSDAQAEETAEPEPFDTGLLETAEVSLIILDVEVVDKKGRPIRGLTRDDFVVRMSGREWPIESVDDFCTCDASTVAGSSSTPESATGSGTQLKGQGGEESTGRDTLAAVAAGQGPEAVPGKGADTVASGRAAAQVGPAGEPPLYVLYFDFSQLEALGRNRAREAAARWVNERMQPDDQVMVVGHASPVGLKELTDFTNSKDAVLAAIEAAFDSRELFDPFPAEYRGRVEECDRCLDHCKHAELVMCEKGCCEPQAFADYRHGKGSLEAMDRLFVTLEQVPGRKAVIHFTQNGMIFPTRMYPLDGNTIFAIGDHLERVSRVGASAVAARVAVHTATLPPEPGWVRLGRIRILAAEATNMGSNLAEATGGTYNRSLFDLDGVLDDAGRGCCFYRIALRAPEKPGRRVFRARVQAGERLLPRSYRVQFMTADERWLRRAQAVLAEPERARGVAVRAALLPHRGGEEAWDLAAQVSFDLESLAFLPFSGKQRGIWRVGAVLVRDDGEEHWKLLAESQVNASEKGAVGINVLHEHLFEGLPPGSYQLFAFVEDRIQGSFGGAESNLVVGLPGEGTVMGPLARRQDEKVMHLSLPELGEEDAAMSRTSSGAGTVPAGSETVIRGMTVQMVTWICPVTAEATAVPPPSMASFIASESGEPLFHLATVEPAATGSCFRFEDAIDTAGLEPGRYLYHARLEQTEVQAEFAVGADPGRDSSD